MRYVSHNLQLIQREYVTDDVGFGAPSTFGGVVATPALDCIAKAGLRYTQFLHVAVLTHTSRVDHGTEPSRGRLWGLGEAATWFPGYDSIIRKDTGTIGRILRDNGYATAWFGKDHNTPFYQASQAGPFDQWPTGMGFDYFLRLRRRRHQPVCGELLILAERENEVQTCQRSRDG